MVDTFGTHYLYRKRGIFYFSRHVPVDVRAHYGFSRNFDVVMLPVHDSFIVSGRQYADLLYAMDKWMNKWMDKHSGIRVPIKVTEKGEYLPNMNLELTKHWEEYDPYDPDAENQVEPRLTGKFVDGYPAHQARVGQTTEMHHEVTFQGSA